MPTIAIDRPSLTQPTAADDPRLVAPIDDDDDLDDDRDDNDVEDLDGPDSNAAAPPPPIIPDAPPTPAPEGWRMRGRPHIVFAHKAGAEVTLTLILSEEETIPLRDGAFARELGLRDKARELAAASPEHDAYVAAQGQLSELVAERDRLSASKADIDKRLEAGPSLDELADLDTAAIDSRLTVLAKAIPPAQRQRDIAARALHAIAKACAYDLRAMVQSEVEGKRATLTDRAKMDAGALSVLVSAELLQGCVSGFYWPDTVADLAIKALTGSACPPPPVVPAPPAPPSMPMFGVVPSAVPLADPFALAKEGVAR